MSRILITGAGGFIGTHLARLCIRRGHAVNALLRASTDASRLDPCVLLHRLDLRDEGAVRACLAEAEPEIVFHLAATPRRLARRNLEDARAFVREDLDGLILLLRTCAAARRPPRVLIRAGSLAEYGAAPVPYREDQREAPVTAYGAQLVAAAHFVAALQPRLPFPVSTARLALVFGPGQSEDYLVPLLVSRCLAGLESEVRRPDDRRDLVFVDDAVSGLLRLAAVQGAWGRVVNICSGSALTMRRVAGEIIASTGADPRLVVFGTDPAVGGTSDLRGCPQLAFDLLGWRTRIAVSEGLQRTIAYGRALSCAGRRVAVPSGGPSQHAGA